MDVYLLNFAHYKTLCERMNSDGAVAFLEAGLERSLQETTRQPAAAMAMAWLEPFPQ